MRPGIYRLGSDPGMRPGTRLYQASPTLIVGGRPNPPFPPYRSRPEPIRHFRPQTSSRIGPIPGGGGLGVGFVAGPHYGLRVDPNAGMRANQAALDRARAAEVARINARNTAAEASRRAAADVNRRAAEASRRSAEASRRAAAEAFRRSAEASRRAAADAFRRAADVNRGAASVFGRRPTPAQRPLSVPHDSPVTLERQQFRATSFRRMLAEAWRASRSVRDALQRERVAIAPLTEGQGPANVDEYSVTIDALPAGVTPEWLLGELMDSPNRVVGSNVFDGLNQFVRTYAGRPADVGDIYEINIPVDSGSVMIVDRQPSYYTVQTVSPFSDLHVTGTHPERGMREFGFERNADSSVTFYTRGLSRPQWGLLGFISRPLQNLGWNSFTRGIGRQVERLGGRMRPFSTTAWRGTL
jgi:hypothetical protein